MAAVSTPYFQYMRIEGRLILETIDELYEALPIAVFMQEAYAYCGRHEEAIRAHIAEAEKAF